MNNPKKTNKNKTLPLFLLIGGLLFLALIVESIRIFWVVPHVFTGKEEITSKKPLIKDVFNELEKFYPQYKNKHQPEFLKQHKISTFPHNPFQGNVSATVTLVIFSDSRCQKCREKVNNILGLTEPYLNKIKIVFKFMSLEGRVSDMDGGIFDQIAWQYDVFKPYMAMVMESDKELQTNDYVNILEKLGVSFEVQKKIMVAGTAPIFASLQQDVVQAKKLGIIDKLNPPVFYLNGYRLGQPNLPEKNISQYIKRLLNGQKIVSTEKH